MPACHRINAIGDPACGIISLSPSARDKKANSVMCQAALFGFGEPSRGVGRWVNPLPFGTTTPCLRLHDNGYREQIGRNRLRYENRDQGVDRSVFLPDRHYQVDVNIDA
jgi:hypothetical protein